MTASTTKSRFEIGEPVNITVTLQNIGLWPRGIMFSSRPFFDSIVYNEEGEEIFRWFNATLHIAYDIHKTLLPTQTITETHIWSEDTHMWGGTTIDFYQVPKGTYTIVASTQFKMGGRDGRRCLLESCPITIEIGHISLEEAIEISRKTTTVQDALNYAAELGYDRDKCEPTADYWDVNHIKSMKLGYPGACDELPEEHEVWRLFWNIPPGFRILHLKRTHS